MDRNDFITTEQHSGECGHCKHAVSAQATTCGACGAHWGFSNGMSRDELYRDANMDIRIGLAYVAVMLVLIVLAMLGLEFSIVLFLFGVLFSIKFLGSHLIAGVINRRNALKASSDEIDWWLKK